MIDIRRYSCIFSLVLIWMFSGCHKPAQPALAPSKSLFFPISDYPFDVGDTWTYQVNYNVYGGTDTLVFTITGKSIIGNDTIFSTQTVSNGVVWDSTIVVKTSDSYNYLPGSPFNSLFDSLWINFPIADTLTRGAAKPDTLICAGANISMQILGTTYTNLTQIKEVKRDSVYSYVNLITLCPNVGIVSENLSTNYGYATKYETILLISYSVH